MTVAQLIELLQQYPDSTTVTATLGNDVVDHIVAAAEDCPPECWDVTVDVELSPVTLCYSTAAGTVLDLQVVLPS